MGHVLWSLAGAVLPLLVGLGAIPILIDGLGIERFGLLVMLWIAIGYFSFLDLGVGRAATRLVAEGHGRADGAALSLLLWSVLRRARWTGIVTGVLIAPLAPLLLDTVLRVPPGLHDEALWSVVLLCLTLPFVVTSSGYVGVLQGHSRFRYVALVRLPLGLANFIGPALVLPWTQSLVAAAAVIALSRVAAWAFFRHACVALHPPPGAGLSAADVDSRQRSQLISFGGWSTVSNVAGSATVYLDRFLVASILGLGSVAYYATPHEVVTRLAIIPTAIADVMFPVLAAALATDVARARSALRGAFLAQLALLLPIICALVMFAPEGMQAWLGEDFAAHGAPVVRWLAIGILVNSFARWPFTLLHALGRPDVPAKLHLIELPLYMVGLWLLLREFGIAGAACAWTLRAAIDALALFLWSGVVSRPFRSTLLLCCACGTAAVLLVVALWWWGMGTHRFAVVALLTAAGAAGALHAIARENAFASARASLRWLRPW